MAKSHFSILEARWWDNGNHTVRHLFAAVAELHYGNPSAFYYDMFADRGSLAALLNVRGADETTEVVYLATHGDEKSFAGVGDVSISRTELRNAFAAANGKRQMKGLFLGTCLAGNHDMAEFMLDKSSGLDWVAGYREEVDWIDGSAIDMIFFSRLAEQYVANVSRKKKKFTALEMAHAAASDLLKLVSGAHSKYGFNLYHVEGKKLSAMFSK